MAVKPSAKDVIVQMFGSMMTVTVDLWPTVSNGTKDTSFKLICPTCDEAHGVSQGYTCTADQAHGPFTTGDCDRAREVSKGVLARVTEQEIEDAKASELDKKLLALEIFSATEVEASTRPKGAPMTVRPQRQANVVAALAKLAAKPDIALVGEMNLRGGENLYRLVASDGQLLVQELARPDAIVPAEPLDEEADPKMVAMMAELAESQVEPFDAARYEDKRKARIAALDEAKRSGTPVPAAAKAAPAPSADEDLTDKLAAALAAAKAGKKGKGGKK